MAEYAASAGAVALVLGNDEVIAEIVATASYASDLSDFFRVEGDRYIQDIGDGGKLYPAFEVGMVEHISHAAQALMRQLGLTPRDYDYAVFQQPYGAIPYVLGERLGFPRAADRARRRRHRDRRLRRRLRAARDWPRCWTRPRRGSASCWSPMALAPAPTR